MLALLLMSFLLSNGVLAVNHTLSYLPFRWDTIPRYTFCSNSSVDYNIGLFNNETLHYIAKQDIMLGKVTTTRFT